MLGYITYPRLGMPTPYSQPMVVSKKQMSIRWKILKLAPIADICGEVYVNTYKNGPLLPASKRKFSSMVVAPHEQFKGAYYHEAQHSIYSRLSQIYGRTFKDDLIEYTKEGLNKDERHVLNLMNIAKNVDTEEEIAHLVEYVNDACYRNALHLIRKIPKLDIVSFQTTAKTCLKKLKKQALNITT